MPLGPIRGVQYKRLVKVFRVQLVDETGIDFRNRAVVRDRLDNVSKPGIKRNNLNLDIFAVFEFLSKRDRIRYIDLFKDFFRCQTFISRIREDCMSSCHPDSLCAMALKSFGSSDSRSSSINPIVDDDTVLAIDITDDVPDFRLILVVTTLVNNSNRSIKLICNLTGTGDSAMIWRNSN